MKKPIVFFDGVCGLCNRFVDYIIEADDNEIYLMSSLQGKTFQKLKMESGIDFPDSVVFYSNGKFLTKSSAALAILKGLGGWYTLLIVFYLVPKFLRDHIYDFVSKNRYKWFGQKETCRLPSPNERKRFLD